jgi:hypothetical protein
VSQCRLKTLWQHTTTSLQHQKLAFIWLNELFFGDFESAQT